MKNNRKQYSIFQSVIAVFMILALLWLSISTPFVFASQQELAKHSKVANAQSPVSATEDESANPFGNSTEEKAPSGNTFSEEYLHDHHIADLFFSIASQSHKCENADIYNAFHGELLVPPPNAA